MIYVQKVFRIPYFSWSDVLSSLPINIGNINLVKKYFYWINIDDNFIIVASKNTR